MKRRKFLKIGGIMAAAAAVPSAMINVPSFMATAIQSIVKRELHYLTIDPKGLDQFANDYINFLEDFPPVAQQKFRMNIASVYFFKKDTQSSTTVEGIINQFLLGSDFFINRMDESKTVNYMGMYDQKRSACINPFSHIYYPPKSTEVL